MINKLRKLLGLCNHKWEVIDEVDFETYSNGRIIETGIQYHLQCKECGNIKVKKV